jgi:hypothetical protein
MNEMKTETQTNPTIKFLEGRHLKVEERVYGYAIRNIRGTENQRVFSREEIKAMQKLGQISLIDYDGFDILTVHIDCGWNEKQ